MPLDRRNLGLNQNPFRERNPENARKRAQLYDAGKARSREVTEMLNARAARRQRKDGL